MPEAGWINLALVVLAGLIGVVGVRGRTWDDTRMDTLSKITRTGWITIVLILLAVGLGLCKEILASREKNEEQAQGTAQKEEKKLQQGVAIVSILADLPWNHLAYIEALRQPKLRKPEYAKETLRVMHLTLKEKVDRHCNQLRSGTVLVAEAALAQQEIAILELSSQGVSMADIVQRLMNAERQTAAFAEAILCDGEALGLDVRGNYNRLTNSRLLGAKSSQTEHDERAR